MLRLRACLRFGLLVTALGLGLTHPVGAQARATPASPDISWSRRAAEHWFGRAETLAARGETAAAISAYTRALRTDATLGRAYLGLAQLRRLFGDVREAEWLLGRAVALSEVRAEALSARAQLFEQLGRDAEALRDLENAARAGPSTSRERELARAYVRRRSWVAALATWRRLRSTLEGAPAEQRREADETILALALLAGEADAVQHPMGRATWVRRTLQRYAHGVKRPAR